MGWTVGTSDGDMLCVSVGLTVATVRIDGLTDCRFVGDELGSTVGSLVGTSDGIRVGFAVGERLAEGPAERWLVGFALGSSVELSVGVCDGARLDTSLGILVWVSVGLKVVSWDGSGLGALVATVGATELTSVGIALGAAVGKLVGGVFGE